MAATFAQGICSEPQSPRSATLQFHNLSYATFGDALKLPTARPSHALALTA
jgi:hypothetical protein